jgi:hypothetical protein
MRVLFIKSNQRRPNANRNKEGEAKRGEKGGGGYEKETTGTKRRKQEASFFK